MLMTNKLITTLLYYITEVDHVWSTCHLQEPIDVLKSTIKFRNKARLSLLLTM